MKPAPAASALRRAVAEAVWPGSLDAHCGDANCDICKELHADALAKADAAIALIRPAVLREAADVVDRWSEPGDSSMFFVRELQRLAKEAEPAPKPVQEGLAL